MPRKRQVIQLTEPDYRSLTKILSKGKSTARVQTRGRVLDLLHRGEHPARVAEILQIGIGTVYNLQRRYLKEGLESALTEKPRSGKPSIITGEMKARITALACSDAPLGHARSLVAIIGRQSGRVWISRFDFL